MAPVEFIFMPLLISKLSEDGKLEDGHLLEAIEIFRKLVNEQHHQTVNVNGKVVKTILDWIKCVFRLLQCNQTDLSSFAAISIRRR